MLIQHVGFNILQLNVNRKMKKLQNRRKLNAQAVTAVDKWIQDNFESEGKLAMGGSGWRPLSPETLMARRSGDADHSEKILQDSGDLKKRWKHFWDDNIGKIQSGVPYGDKHHKGLSFLPVRRILPLEQQISPILMKLYEHFVKVALNG